MNLNKIVIFLFCAVLFFAFGCNKQSNYDKAVAYQNDAEYSTAIKFYNMAIKHGEKIAESEKNLGDIFVGDKNFEEAFKHYKNSMETDPNVALETVFKYISFNDIKVREIVGKIFSEIQNEQAQKQINEKLSEILNSKNQYKILDALFIVSQMKEKAVPLADDVAKLLDGDNVIKQKVLETLPSLASAVSEETLDKIIALLSDKNEIMVFAAIECLGNMHEYGMDALPDLLNLAATKNRYKEQALSAVEKLGLPTKQQLENIVEKLELPTKEQMESIQDILKDKPKDIKIYIINTFGNYSEKANIYVPYIMKFLNDKDSDIKQVTRDVLTKIGKASSETIPELIKLLNEKNEEILSRAIYELGDLGKNSSAAIEPLNNLLKSASSKEIKRLAKDALQKIQ